MPEKNGKKAGSKSKTKSSGAPKGKRTESAKPKPEKKSEPFVDKVQTACTVKIDPEHLAEFPRLRENVKDEHLEYLSTVLNNPIRQFQKSTVDEFLRLVEEEGLPSAVGDAIDSRDYTKGDTWQQARMNIMNSILPRGETLTKILREGVEQGSTKSVKWFAEASGNPKEIRITLEPALKSDKSENRFWAAIHLSRHAPAADGLTEALQEALAAEWIAMKMDHSATGITGKGEAARALSRLGKQAAAAKESLMQELSRDGIESADAAEVVSAYHFLTGDIDKTLELAAEIAEKVLIERRGRSLHEGDKELLRTLRRLISKWKSNSENQDDESEWMKKVEMLDSEIRYHLPE